MDDSIKLVGGEEEGKIMSAEEEFDGIFTCCWRSIHSDGGANLSRICSTLFEAKNKFKKYLTIFTLGRISPTLH